MKRKHKLIDHQVTDTYFIKKCTNCDEFFHYEYNKDPYVGTINKCFRLSFPPDRCDDINYYKSSFKIIRKWDNNYHSFALGVLRNGNHYLINPFTGKIYTKVYCPISGRDRLIKDII